MDKKLKLFVMQLFHTAVWVFFVTVIFYILYSELVNKINVYTWIAIGLVFLEGFILLLFKNNCPLSLIARKYTDSEKENFDIFLPNWLARYNKLIFSLLFVLGLIIIGFRVIYKI
jgi:hypothetical protein